MGVEEIAKSTIDVVTLGAVSRREQAKAADRADEARRRAEAEELKARKEAAEKGPEEESATLELLATGRGEAIGKGDLLVEPTTTKPKSSLGRGASGTGLGFKV